MEWVLKVTQGGKRYGKEKNMSNRKKSSATAESDEVEQLLQAAQDEMLLKLSVDSHMSRVAPDYLDPNLHRRFQALRSRPSTSQSKSQLQKQSPAPLKQQQQQQKEEEKKEQKSNVVVVGNVDEELRGVLGDDLSARFAALKAPLSSSSSDPAPAPAATKEVSIGLDKSDGEDEEDEVENVIRWAMDAARLDPSPPSDDDDDHIDSDVDDNDDDNDDDDYPKNKKKESKSSRK